MRVFKSSKGGASVEASLILPIAMLTVSAMLMTGIKMLDRVRAAATVNRAYSKETLYPLMPAETVLRLKWLGIKIVENSAD